MIMPRTRPPSARPFRSLSLLPLASLVALGTWGHAQAAPLRAEDDLAARTPGLAMLGPTLGGGGVGLLGMSTALSGPPWQLRAALHLFGYQQSDFLIARDRHRSFSGALQLDLTLGRYLELWLSMAGSSSQNERASATRQDPLTQRTLADLRVGAKIHGRVTRGLSLAAQPLLGFSGGGDFVGPVGDTLSGGADLLASLDLRELHPRVPLRLHLSAGYYHDRSGNLLASPCADVKTDPECAYARLVTSTSQGVRPARGRFAVGAEVPLRLSPWFTLTPLAAYHLEVHTGDGDAVIREGLMARGAASPDRINSRALQWLELGLRAHTAAHLTVDVGILGSLSPAGFAYGAQLPQVAGYGALTWATDLSPRRSAPRDLPPRRSGPAGSEGATPLASEQSSEGAEPSYHSDARAGVGRVRGVVRDARSGVALAGAVLRFPGRRHNPILSDERGEFEAGPFPAGKLWLEVSRGEFERRRMELAVQAGQIGCVEITLTARAAQPAPLRIDVLDEKGVAVPALVVAMRDEGTGREARGPGAPINDLPPDIRGGFQRDLPAGTWRVRVDSEGFLSRELQVALSAGVVHRQAVSLRRRPQSPAVRLGPDNLVLKSSVSFEPATAVLTGRSAAVLDEIVDLLVWHPELTRLRIEGHTDATGQSQQNQQLSEERAITVRNYLIKQGIAAERLQAAGFGSTQPLGPESSMEARARNRRVTFKILERALTAR